MHVVRTSKQKKLSNDQTLKTKPEYIEDMISHLSDGTPFHRGCDRIYDWFILICVHSTCQYGYNPSNQFAGRRIWLESLYASKATEYYPLMWARDVGWSTDICTMDWKQQRCHMWSGEHVIPHPTWVLNDSAIGFPRLRKHLSVNMGAQAFWASWSVLNYIGISNGQTSLLPSLLLQISPPIKQKKKKHYPFAS